MKPRFNSLIAACAPLSRSAIIFCASLCAATSAHADQTWTGDALDGFWTSASNWSGTTIPGTGDVAIFDVNSDTNTATTLAATFSIKGLKIVDPIAAVSIAAGNTLTLDSSGIDMTAATQNLSIASPLVAGVSQSWNIASGRLLTITSEVSGTSFTKSGLGDLLLTSANLITGTVQHNAGRIIVRNGTALGPNTNTLALANGSTFRIENNGGSTTTFVGIPITVAASSSVTMTSNSGANGYSGLVSGDAASVFNIGATGATTQVSFSLASNTQQFGSFLGRVEIFDGASIRFSATSSVNNGGSSAVWDNNTSGNITARNTGTINLGSLVGAGSVSGSSGATGTTTFSIGGRSEDCTYDGTLVDATPGSRIAALTKVGSATLTLTNTTGLTYGGATNVNEGILKINGVKSGGGSTTVKIDTTLAGTGSIAGTTTIQNGGTLAPGDGGVGNITLSNLTLSSGSILNIQFGTGNDTATVSTGGTLALTAGATVNVNGFDTDGTYTIINRSGATVSGTASTALSAVGGNPSKIYTFADTGTAITMTISSSDPSNYWNIDGGGTWELAGNWTKNQIPDAISAIAKIGPGIGGAGVVLAEFSDLAFTITLDANQILGTLAFDDTTGTAVTIDPGLTTPGSLFFDNGASASILAGIAGTHVVNAPVVVDANGLAVDVSDDVDPLTPTFSLTLNGVVSGSGAAISKSGSGILALMGENNYNGGTTLNGGILRIGTLTSLGATSAAATFTGGTLQLGAAITGDTRSLLVSGASNAIIDTNGSAYDYDGVIAPAGGGTGGLTKSGGGTLTLTAAQSYTGATNVNGGTLAVAGGSIISGATSSVASAALTLSSGSVAFNAGFNVNTSNPSSNAFIHLTGGTFSASSLTMGRCTSNTQIVLSPATAGRTEAGLYINGADATITGALNVGQGTNTNSTSTARIDSGSLTVGGAVIIQVNSPDRWSVLDVNGGTFTATNAAGVQIGSGLTGNDVFLVRNTGTATVEKFLLTQPAASTLTSRLNLLGGTLYVGEGGIVGTNNGGTGMIDVQLGTATLGAKATWSTLLGATLNGTTVIKAADAANAAHDISIAGVLSGTGGLEKTGNGALTLAGDNAYTGTTTVTAGTLNITGNSSLATGDVTVAAAATLAGNGNIGANVTIQSTGRHALDVAATSGAQVTRVIAGTLNLDAGNILNLTAAAPPAAGTYILATASSIIGAPTTINYNGIPGAVTVVGGNSLVLTVSNGSDFTTWIDGFTFAPGADKTATGDPDGDGLKNQQEYAFGLIPNSGSSVNPITAQLSKTTGLFTYTRRKPSLTSLTYVYQYSTTLGSWTTFTPDGTTSNSGDPVEAITVDVPDALLSNGKLFVRVAAQ